MKTKTRAVALSVAIATSGLAGAALAGAQSNADRADRAMELQAAAKPAALKPDPAALRQELLAEIARLTPEQRKKLGEKRVQRAAQLSEAQLAAGGCITHGVFCKGTSGFTNGLICCILKKKKGG